MHTNGKLVGLGAYPARGCGQTETRPAVSHWVLGVLAAGVAAMTYLLLFTGQRPARRQRI